MTVFNLGSINLDRFYRVPHLPAPGETLAVQSLNNGLGGKGANMSVAIARAGASAHHIGAIGADEKWMILSVLNGAGVDTSAIYQSTSPTGHAIISVDGQGENSILLFSGANHDISEAHIRAALEMATDRDIFLCQNETLNQTFFAEIGSNIGARVAYAAAPFDVEKVRSVLPFIDLLFVNEIEAEQLETALGTPLMDLDVDDIIVTLGGAGARHLHRALRAVTEFAAHPVTPVDTTGAGDTFTGYVLAGLDLGMEMQEAIRWAMIAGALMVTRVGTADVIPTAQEVAAFSPS